MQELFDWKIALRDIGEHGRSGTHKATAEERIELARVLDIVSCDALTVTYEVHALSAGMYRLNGKIVANVVQACVITLEPIPAKLDEEIHVELRPAHLMPEAPEGEQEVFAANDIEPIEDDTIDLGLLVLEHISTALDPYPRKPDAEFKFVEEDAKAGSKPFAALANLKLVEKKP